MWFALCQIGTYLLHEIAVENLFNAVAVQVAQHVGVASTTGFDIALGIDMQAAPGGCTVKIRHPVFTGRSLAPGCFGFAVVFTGKSVGNEPLTQTAAI